MFYNDENNGVTPNENEQNVSGQNHDTWENLSATPGSGEQPQHNTSEPSVQPEAPQQNTSSAESSPGPGYNTETGFGETQAGGSAADDDVSAYPGDPYGGNVQYKWNYDDYQRALQANGKKKKKNRGLIALIISLCSVFGVAVIALAGFGIYSLSHNGLPLISQGTSSQGTNTADNSKARSGPSLTINSKPSGGTATTTTGGALTVQQCAKKVLPSVVGIVDYSLNQLGETGEGSGIIMSSDGYIITNNHVISGADRYQVVLQSGTKYDATLVGKDSKTDLAVLKINATGLTAATFGNSQDLEVGDTVIAIGNPGGLELAETVTQGIISALNRTVNNATYIQTDASINPGNSGGPLVNTYGQVIGINAAKIADTDYEGIGFSIPINIAKPVVDDLIKYGYVKDRVKLGITVSVFDESQARYYNLPQGLLVSSVETTSDAAQKGVQKNDIITKVNGKQITQFSDLTSAEDKLKPGDTITLTICRYTNGSSRTFNVTVKLMEDRGDTTSSTTTQDSSGSNGSNNNQQNGSNYSDYFNIP